MSKQNLKRINIDDGNKNHKFLEGNEPEADKWEASEALESFLTKALCNYDLPGLAVAVGKGTQRFRKGLGSMDLDSQEPVTEKSIFHMASVTKLFVGTSLMQLWEKGLVDVEEKLITYLPWFEMADSRYKEITLRQLLSHTAGMPDVEDYHWDCPRIDEDALKQYICSDEVKKAHLLWAPGSGGFRYSNIGYEILGVVIAERSGMPFETYVQKNILDPLAMEDSTLLTFTRADSLELDALKAAGVCTPYKKDETKHIVKESQFPYNREHGPSSTLTTNMIDIEKWARAHLEQMILSPQTYELMWQEQAVVPNNGEKICLSWFKREQNGYVLFGHEGTDDGFRASFWLCPELDLYIAVAANLSGAAVKKIGKQIFDLLTESFKSF